MKGVGTDEDTWIEIIVSRPTPILKMIKAAYKNKYGKELEDAISSEVSGDLKRLLITLLQCKRSDNRNPNDAQCNEYAKQLFQAGEEQ